MPDDLGHDRQQQLDLVNEIAGEDAAVKGGGNNVVMIDHRDLDPATGNRPSGMDAEALAGLAASIATRGLDQPLTVRPLPLVNGTFGKTRARIIDGERRWRAIGLLIADDRWPADRKIPCLQRICNPLDEILGRLSANLQREDLNPLDECEGVAAAVHEAEFEHGAGGTSYVARMLGKKLRWVQIRVQVARDLTDLDKARLRAGEIGIGAARDMIAEHKPKSKSAPGAADPAAASPATESAQDAPKAPETGGGGSPGDADVTDTSNAAETNDKQPWETGKPTAKPLRPETPAPVRETMFVRKIDLVDIVPVHATLESDDPFPRLISFMDARSGQTVDYFREDASERRDRLEGLLARATTALICSATSVDAALMAELRDVLGWNDPLQDGTESLRGGAAAARLAHNQEVAGSSPAPATTSDAEWLIRDPAGDVGGTCADAHDFTDELIDVYVSTCDEAAALDALWRHNEAEMLRLPGDLHARLAGAFESRKLVLGGRTMTVKNESAAAPMSLTGGGQGAGEGTAVASFPGDADAPSPALDLRGRIGAAVSGLTLSIPRFLRRKPDGSRMYPDAKPGDDADRESME